MGYLGPEGTFSGEALAASSIVADGLLGEVQAVALPTITDTVLAVQERLVDRAIVPIENSLEGSVDVTLDALALDAPDVEIVHEDILPVRHCLIVREAIDLASITRIVSHPQVIGQCARFVRSLTAAEIVPASSTAEAVRLVAEADAVQGWAALGNRLAAEIYACRVLSENVADHGDNETRFVWLAPHGSGPVLSEARRWKTSLVFWGAGARAAGWLVSCLDEFARREINLTRIESRPRGHGLGRYMFFADLEGAPASAELQAAIGALGEHCDAVRVLGSYPASDAAP